MFWATSESVYSGIVSRKTSASPRHRSRSKSTTELSGSAASEQPRFTARLVVPTPPVAPVTAIIVHAAARVARAAGALPGDALQRGGQVFGLERLREELFCTGPHRSQDQVAIGRRAGNEQIALGRRLGERFDQLESPFPDCYRER